VDLFVRFGEKKKKNTKKTNFRCFFDTLFPARNRQTVKKITSVIPNDQNVGQKHFHGILIRIGGENSKY
jgi:hypothetical protein